MAGMSKWPIRHILQRAAWETARVMRAGYWRFGRWGMLMTASLGIGFGASIVAVYQENVLRRLSPATTGMQASPAAVPGRPDAPRSPPLRTRLRSFEEILVPHDEIPDTLKRLIALAGESGVVLSRGEYKPLADARGGFVRYRMTLPLKGDALAIHAFILTALEQNRSLALEEVRFKRERVNSTEIEARLQWVLFARMAPHLASGEEALPANSTANVLAKDFE